MKNMGHTNFNLQRFLDAQEDMYPVALKEIRKGGKQSHWIWYIFPQEKGLGYSYNSQFYGLDGEEEPGPIWRIRYWELVCGKLPVLCWRIADIVQYGN